MERFRNHPPTEIAGSPLIMVKDYEGGKARNLLTAKETEMGLPKSDVLQFFTANGNKISIRPSGTEPKVKFYFGVKATLLKIEDFDKVDAELEQMIGLIMKSLEV